MARKKAAAKPDEPATEPKTWKTEMLLDVALTADESLDRTRELRERREGFVAFKAARDRTMKLLDVSLKAARAELDRVETICLNGAEPREVACTATLRKATAAERSQHGGLMVEIRRDDTGEIVETRVPTWLERQEDMAFEEEDEDNYEEADDAEDGDDA
jgi:hypothetical protein